MNNDNLLDTYLVGAIVLNKAKRFSPAMKKQHLRRQIAAMETPYDHSKVKSLRGLRNFRDNLQDMMTEIRADDFVSGAHERLSRKLLRGGYTGKANQRETLRLSDKNKRRNIAALYGL